MSELVYDKTEAKRTAMNPFQGRHKRVLCVCSAGLLRSPTTAEVLSQKPFEFNTRSAGIEHYALIPVTEVLLHWADEIVCMTWVQANKLKEMTEKRIVTLGIPDQFEFRNEELRKLIVDRYPKEPIVDILDFT